MEYCPSIYCTKRWKTREVMVGEVAVGGTNPIRIQSMTNTDTRDVDAIVDQIMRLADEGCEIARVTVQGKREAEACEKIKSSLVQKGYQIPLVADIHFYPPAALLVAEFVDKVRINPGNFADRRASFLVKEYSDESYSQELEKIQEKFTPLVEKCKRLKRAMRIGTNHGSLSDRIMNRFGDTARGMVESALEYARICRDNDYHSFIFSMKASNTHVMIQAYRLLVAKMLQLGWDYPLHLGVTEAGEGEDGRVKSAIGIGALLLDGLGDTIRVSLTEDPVKEIDPCRRLVAFAEASCGKGISPFIEKRRTIEAFERRKVRKGLPLPLHRDGTVALRVSNKESDLITSVDCKEEAGTFVKGDAVPDLLFVENQTDFQELSQAGIGLFTTESVLPLKASLSHHFSHPVEHKSPSFLLVRGDEENLWPSIAQLNPHCILLRPKGARLHTARKFFDFLKEEKLSFPVLLNFTYTLPWDDFVIQASSECGALLTDGLGEGVFLEGDYPLDALRKLSFNILQGCRLRSVKTEFISCPSCGRTLFDLQEVSERIRKRTGHLPGVKVAIMGCIVNGPGEMADADFGYVGSRPDKVDLYVGKERVEKNIDFSEADERLVSLIKSHGRWIEP